MATIFAAFPSYRGISEEEAKQRCGYSALVAAGHTVAVAVLREHALLDYARAELTGVFMAHKMDLMLCQDDDISVSDETILKMIELASLREDKPNGSLYYPVISAPCRLRSEGHAFNVLPTSAPDERRMMECAWTGLGCVLIAKSAIEWLAASNTRLWFDSALVPGKSAVALFNSIVADAGDYDPSREGHGVFLGDDRAFSHRCRLAGIPIHAYVDAKTSHRGLDGCFGEEIRKMDEEARRQGHAPVERVGLLGPDGRPL